MNKPINAAPKRNFRPQLGHETEPTAEVSASTSSGATAIPEQSVDHQQLAVNAMFGETSYLDEIPPREGFTQKWIRVSIGGEDDVRNVAKMTQLGWRPRPASSIPGGYSPPTIRNKQLGDVVGVGDLVLCEMPLALHKRIKDAVKQRLDNQLQAVNQSMHQQTAGRVETLKRESIVSDKLNP